MNIVLASRWYPPHSGFGGVAMYTHQAAHAFKKLGHDVTVVALRHHPDDPKFEDDSGVKVHRILHKHYSLPYRIPFIGRHYGALALLIYSFRLARKLKEIEKQEKIDIIEFPEVEGEGFIYLLAKRKTTTIVRCHSPMFVLQEYIDTRDREKTSPFIFLMEKICLRRANIVTAPSKFIADIVSSSARIPLERIKIYPNGLPGCRFAESVPQKNNKDSMTILYVGRLAKIKGVEILARAIPKVVKQIENARFVLVGDDRPYDANSTWMEWLKNYFREKSCENNVSFTGGITDSTKLGELYQESDVVVIPSLFESYSYTCVQAMAQGVPVILSQNSGVGKELIHGEHAMLYDPNNSEELANLIIQICQNNNLRQALGKNAFQWSQINCEADTVAKQGISIYKEAQ